ncbi:MAG: alcohol dehydrogenase catalytic domain-containing protein [Chloroflexi bacterium]|nr:alcohol dehydrogenase catalytic domain-containing protein [Chloroflexota bacterium]MBU1750946.1 alcohol dehydrogenase catalytic domain-containing protein [Chloroflexota bacterium]
MKGLVLEADWNPKAGYAVSEWETRTHKAITGNAVWHRPQLGIKDVPMPTIQPNEVLIQIKACGVCGSDMHFYETDKDGYILYPGLTKFPAILGHEFSGQIVEVGCDVDDLVVGDMVTAEEMIWCGHCRPCRDGFPNHCTNLEEIGFTIDGAFAEYIAIGAKYCWKLNDIYERLGDETKTYEAGALVEPASVAYNGIFERAGGFRPGAAVVVYGAGPIGLSSIAECKAAGAARLFAFEVGEARRELAKMMGADYVFDPRAVSPHQVVLDLTHGLGADFQVEAAGAPDKTIPEMEQCLAINGKIVQIGRAATRVPMYLETLQVRRSQVFGAQGHSGHGTFPNVISLMAAGLVDLTPIITARYDLDHAVDGIAQSTSRQDGKVMVKI